MSRSERDANEALASTRRAFRQNHKPAKTPTWWLSPALAVTLGVALAYLALKWATG